MVDPGDDIFPGGVLAKIPRETTKTKDITGGLPRVVELFEARKPKETAVITGDRRRGALCRIHPRQRKIVVENESAETRAEYLLPRGVHINVQEGEFVKAGEALMDGPRNSHDILKVLGEKEMQSYMVNEVQEVYRLQGVNINDKHIEVIVRQMMRWIKVENVGDTEFLLEEQVDRFRFPGGESAGHQGRRDSCHRPTSAAGYHQGVSEHRILHFRGVVPGDHPSSDRGLHPGQDRLLEGLKENVIMGRLIPAGTGMDYYRAIEVERPVREIEEAPRSGDGARSRTREDRAQSGVGNCRRPVVRGRFSVTKELTLEGTSPPFVKRDLTPRGRPRCGRYASFAGPPPGGPLWHGGSH